MQAQPPIIIQGGGGGASSIPTPVWLAGGAVVVVGGYLLIAGNPLAEAGSRVFGLLENVVGAVSKPLEEIPETFSDVVGGSVESSNNLIQEGISSGGEALDRVLDSEGGSLLGPPSYVGTGSNVEQDDGIPLPNGNGNEGVIDAIIPPIFRPPPISISRPAPPRPSVGGIRVGVSRIGSLF